MGAYLCQRLPWHHWVIERKVSSMSRKLACSCGREYACNDFVGVIRPWHAGFDHMYDVFHKAMPEDME